jgi:hypothetical protein
MTASAVGDQAIMAVCGRGATAWMPPLRESDGSTPTQRHDH